MVIAMVSSCSCQPGLRTPSLFRRSLQRSQQLSNLVVCFLFLGLAACQDTGLSPELAATKTNRNLTVTGGGNGGGQVTAPQYGETKALDCVITNGIASGQGCIAPYGWKTTVTLTATPDPGGSRFTGWSGACSGTATTCRVMMTQSRSVTASFAGQGIPTYRLNVSGGGDGNGTVTSQPAAINCQVAAGSASSGTCSATYDQGTVVTLTAAASSGHTFNGWSGDCSGTGNCVLTMSAAHAVGASFSAPAGIEATVGKWDAPKSMTIIGVHATQLFGGNVLLWGHLGEPQVWDPSTGNFTQRSDPTCNNANCELFCAGETYLANGDLLVAGGHDESLGDNNGLTQASIFDASGWRATGQMSLRRWYPTLVTLADGSVVALSGDVQPGTNADIPERYANGVWSLLSTAGHHWLPLYPRAFVEPKQGKVFVADDLNNSSILDPSGGGSWATGPVRVVGQRSYGSAVMLDTKVLFIGGGGDGLGQQTCPNDLPTNTAEIIDLAAASPAWSQVATMHFRRRQTNATILPDGKVLVTGGTSQCGFTNEAGAVFAAEIWDPDGGPIGTWTQVAAASVVRVYHGTTVLLADGRVLSTGSGDGGGATFQYNYEVYSPPYLFKGARPTYGPGPVPTSIRYGISFVVPTPNAASIRKVTLIRLAASTHAFDMGQRLNTLSFTPAADGLSLTVTPPAAGRLAPPGPYRLFIVDDKGVPSVGQTVLVGP